MINPPCQISIIRIPTPREDALDFGPGRSEFSQRTRKFQHVCLSATIRLGSRRPANGFDSTGCTCSAATRRPSYAANRLDANPTQRIYSARIQHSESTQLGGGGNASRMERPAHLGSIGRAWRGARYAANGTALPASDTDSHAESTARIASGCVRSPPWRTRDSSDGSVLRVACDVRPLLAYAIRRPGREAVGACSTCASLDS
ncbi:hypothetical protein C8R43DRAFT_369960 [Mycena crocata]|nr:hypothetical protein C8R43DRAFT_369960 [Mycena crocata]